VYGFQTWYNDFDINKDFINPAVSGTKNYCADEDRQPHTQTKQTKHKEKLFVSLRNVIFMQDICSCAVNRRQDKCHIYYWFI
jgi:hypothetical protein